MLFDDTRLVGRSGDLIVGESPQFDKTRIVDDTRKLIDGFQEAGDRFFIADLLRNEVATTQRVEIALLAAALFGGLGQKQVTGMFLVWSFVEVALKGAGQKAEVVLLNVRLVLLFYEPILFVNDRIVRQHFGRLESCRVHSLVFGGGDGEQFRQFHPESYRYVSLFGNDAAMLNGHDRKFTFQRRHFQCVSHRLFRIKQFDNAFARDDPARMPRSGRFFHHAVRTVPGVEPESRYHQRRTRHRTEADTKGSAYTDHIHDHENDKEREQSARE